MKSSATIDNNPQLPSENDFKSEEIHDEFEAVSFDSFFNSIDDEWDEYSMDEFEDF